MNISVMSTSGVTMFRNMSGKVFAVKTRGSLPRGVTVTVTLYSGGGGAKLARHIGHVWWPRFFQLRRHLRWKT